VYSAPVRNAVRQVFLEVRCVIDFLQEFDVPLQGVFRHFRRAEDAAQHEVVDIDAKRLFDRRDILPIANRNARRVENC
jgi:hypothetical protein